MAWPMAPMVVKEPVGDAEVNRTSELVLVSPYRRG